jgi:hypothetical protein
MTIFWKIFNKLLSVSVIYEDYLLKQTYVGEFFRNLTVRALGPQSEILVFSKTVLPIRHGLPLYGSAALC